MKFDRVEHLEEPIYAMLPNEPQLEDDVIYIVTDPQYIEYNCPCGCGNVVMIPYFSTEKPADRYGWTMREGIEGVTLSPSVFSKDWPCRSHYFIQNNRICWCG